MSSRDQLDPKTVFEISRNPMGRWCVRRADGLVFGIFREHAGAIYFVHHECRNAVIRG